MPNIIVLFELKPTPEGRARYLELAAMLKPLLSGFEGFVRAERFESLADHSKLLSMNVWTDEAAVSRWRNTLKHRLAQKEGRGKLIESYRVTVCAELPLSVKITFATLSVLHGVVKHAIFAGVYR